MRFRQPNDTSVAATAIIAMAVFVVACGGADTEPVALETLGLAIETDIQAGSTFEVTVPAGEDTSVVVASVPAGVTASISEDPIGDSMILRVAVEPDTPRGDYIVLLRAERDGEGAELEWPFGVVEPDAPVEQTSTDQPGPSPADVRDEVAALIAARDSGSLRTLWPSPSWEDWAAELVPTFVPSSDNGECDLLDDGQANCFIFAQDDPFVIGLTLARDGDRWTIVAAGYDSTN